MATYASLKYNIGTQLTGEIPTAAIADNAVTTAKINADAVTAAKVADDIIDSEHLAAGSIDTAHIADDQITLAKMAGITRGQIIYGNASGNPTALAIGTSGYALTSDGNDISWGSVSETKPTISSISPSVITNAATNVTITGTNFVNTPLVEVINSSGVITLPNSVSFTNATTIVVNLTLGTDATYFLRVENNDGNAVRSSTALLTVSDEPAWTTAAGSLGSFSGASTIGTINLTATNSTGMAVQSGSLPGGISLNSASGTSTLTGTESGASSDTTYNFTIRATDAEAQYVDRAFSLSFTFAINNSIRFGG